MKSHSSIEMLNLEEKQNDDVELLISLNFVNAIKSAMMVYVGQSSGRAIQDGYNKMIRELDTINIPYHRKIDIDTLHVILQVAEIQEKNGIELARDIQSHLINNISTGLSLAGYFIWHTGRSHFRDMLSGVLISYYPVLFLNKKILLDMVQNKECKSENTQESSKSQNGALEQALEESEKRYEDLIARISKLELEKNKVSKEFKDLDEAHQIFVSEADKVKQLYDTEKSKNEHLNLKIERLSEMVSTLKKRLDKKTQNIQGSVQSSNSFFKKGGSGLGLMEDQHAHEPMDAINFGSATKK